MLDVVERERDGFFPLNKMQLNEQKQASGLKMFNLCTYHSANFNITHR